MATTFVTPILDLGAPASSRTRPLPTNSFGRRPLGPLGPLGVLGPLGLVAGAAGAAGVGCVGVASRVPRRRRTTWTCRFAQRLADYYEILKVSRNANEREIKASFRKLARQYHPDVNKEPGALEKFQEIAKAYEILADASKREQYNQFGEGAVSNSAGPDLSSMDLKDILGDVFNSFFNGSPGGPGGVRARTQTAKKQGAKKGADLECKIEVPFDVACFGGSHSIQVQREETCKSCGGRGITSDASKHKRCSKCNGTGATQQVMQTPLGVMQTQLVCPKCRGSGVDPMACCRSCGGKGTQRRAQEISVNIPAGCNMGSKMRIKGEGDKGVRGGPPGDLYITLKISSSRDFVRDGIDVYNEKAISVFDAMLGTSVRVTTVDGFADIEVPAGTQPGTTLRLRGRGVPKLNENGVRGDHYVTLRVEVPYTLNDAQRKLVAKLKQACE